MIALAKPTIAGALLGVVAVVTNEGGIVTHVFGKTASAVVFLAAFLAGVVYLVKALRLAAKFLRHWIDVLEIIPALPGRLDKVDQRLDNLERKADQIQEPAEAVARELRAPHRAV